MAMDDKTSDQDRVLIEAAFADRARLKDAAHVAAVERTLARLDRGELRVASPPAEGLSGDELGEWTTHAWTKQAILLYFANVSPEPVRVMWPRAIVCLPPVVAMSL